MGTITKLLLIGGGLVGAYVLYTKVIAPSVKDKKQKEVKKTAAVHPVIEEKELVTPPPPKAVAHANLGRFISY
jgi:hypothetical protein